MKITKNKLIGGMIILVLIIGGSFSLYRYISEKKSIKVVSQENIPSLSLSNIPGVYVPEDVLSKATSTIIVSDEEMILYSDKHNEEKNTYDASYGAYFCGSYSWRMIAKDVISLAPEKPSECSGVQARSFDIKLLPSGIVLVEKNSGRVWRRKPYYSFEYKEGGKDKRLTLYEVPECYAHACGGLIQGVFEVKNDKGNFSIIKVMESEGSFSYGRLLEQSAVPSDIVAIGLGKMALQLSWGDLNQGFTRSSDWLLEFDNERISYVGSFINYEDNDGNCDPSLISFDTVNRVEPCVMYTGTTTVDMTKVSPDGYYDVVVRKKGTEFDSEKDKVKKVNPETRYIFNGSRYKESLEATTSSMSGKNNK